MQGIEITLQENKQIVVENRDDYKVLEGENNATTILVHFPEEYENYSKKVDFLNKKHEKWSISLFSPEDERNAYDEAFDRNNFTFTLPTEVTIRGELQIQFIAYLADRTETIVPFEIVYINIENSVLYARKQSSQNPDLILRAYEYSNEALERSRDAQSRATEAERAAVASENSSQSSAQSAAAAQASATAAQNSASAAQTSAKASENSAKAAQTSASNAEKSAATAKTNSYNAVATSNSANTKSDNAVSTSNSANTKAIKALEIVDALSVTSEEISRDDHVSVTIQTNASTKHKNIHFKVPAPKQGKSYVAKGAWQSGVEYLNNEYYIDTVSMYGCTYYCKKTNTNKQPVDSDDTEFWGILASRGSDAGFTIVDNLESDNANYALSAKQGKILKELIASSITTAINNLIAQAPENLNTLKEIATAINNDPNFYTTISTSITNNVKTLEQKLTALETKINQQIENTKTQLEQSAAATKADLVKSINDLQKQINNMLNGTTVFTLMKANTIDLV